MMLKQAVLGSLLHCNSQTQPYQQLGDLKSALRSTFTFILCKISRAVRAVILVTSAK
jgi:hypothetical protein